MTAENIYVHRNGDRHCRRCHAEREIAKSRAQGSKPYEPPAMPTDPAVLGYAAGILDGEGSISIQATRVKGRAYHRAIVRATSTDKCLIDWLVEHFGGTCRASKTSERGRRVPYNWLMTSGATQAFLAAVRPYLVIKGPQADVALAFGETKLRTGDGRAGIVTPELREYREQLRQHMLALNRREAV